MLSGTAPECPSPFKNVLVSGPLFAVGQQQKAMQKGLQSPCVLVARQHGSQA